MSTFFLKGSRPPDLPHPPDDFCPLPACPPTPNCMIQSVPFDRDPESLFKLSIQVIGRFNPVQTDTDSQSLQIKAVFRIPVFGFRDDVQILIEPGDSGSILHIRSTSRVGRSDLGVNRRRVRRILNRLQQNL